MLLKIRLLSLVLLILPIRSLRNQKVSMQFVILHLYAKHVQHTEMQNDGKPLEKALAMTQRRFEHRFRVYGKQKQKDISGMKHHTRRPEGKQVG